MEVITIDDMPLHYTVEGHGAPMIVMHGWGCNHSTVASIATVAARTHTVYTIDFPGFGETPEPSEVWGVERYTRLIEKFVKALGLDAPVLLGHSFGGRVGILYASRNQVDKLILVDSAGIKPRRKLSYYYKVYSFKLMKRLANMFMPADKAHAFIERKRAGKGSADYNSASPRMRSILSKVVNEDLRDRLPLVKAPTLLIWGENDTATPLSDARLMHRLLPDSGLVSFPGCGHYSFLENPSRFAAVLHSFLKS
ncbi:MAG: alpha/beta hydrolase [Paramuribaculum sp.]|nr:alpha/beta hydrolase [Paramuribaculum sp.]